MATQTAVSSFFPLVMPWAPGVPMMAVRQEIVRAAVRLCEEAQLWQEAATAVNVVAATHTYAVPAPTGGQLVHVIEAYYDGSPLPPTTFHELYNNYTDWASQTGTPQKYLQTDPVNIRVFPIPETADALVGGLTMRCAYKPTMTTTTLPDFLFTQFGFTVAAGALASLLSMPGRTWSNPGLVKYYLKQYDSGVSAAKIDASKNFTTASRMTWRKFV